MIGMHLMRAKVSLDRIAEFLEEEELEKYDDDDDDDDDVNNANDHRSRDQTSAADSVDISESTPLLITDDGNSIVQIRLNPETELPPDYVKPEVGFYAGKFIHYGAPETSPSTFDAASAANDKKKWWQFWRKSQTFNTISVQPDEPALAKPESIPFQLRNVSVNFPHGALSVIVGPTGSGKTSMLLSLLGEMKRLEGYGFLPDPRYAPGGIAYVAQTSFLLNATIRENILFGNDFHEERFEGIIFQILCILVCVCK